MIMIDKSGAVFELPNGVQVSEMYDRLFMENTTSQTVRVNIYWPEKSSDYIELNPWEKKAK